jgi:hypothetical protein
MLRLGLCNGIVKRSARVVPLVHVHSAHSVSAKEKCHGATVPTVACAERVLTTSILEDTKINGAEYS